MDKRLIDADKLLAHINSIRNDHIEKRNEGDECDRFANDAVADWLFILSNDIEKGIFDPDPIPLPTIKPGDKVRHKDRKMKYLGIGNVLEISASGQRVRVEWPNYDKKRSMWEPYPAYYRLDKLEVISHD